MSKDPGFGKSPQLLRSAIDTSPFYVCESLPILLVYMGGSKTNTDLQVLDQNFGVIPGSNVAGNAANGFWGDSNPSSIFFGIARDHALTFGRFAGLNAAGS